MLGKIPHLILAILVALLIVWNTVDLIRRKERRTPSGLLSYGGLLFAGLLLICSSIPALYNWRMITAIASYTLAGAILIFAVIFAIIHLKKKQYDLHCLLYSGMHLLLIVILVLRANGINIA